MKLCLRCNQYFEDSIELCPIDTSNLESVGEHPLIGALINDRYVVDSVIGKGSSGIVYKATRLLMGREVAVKVLHSYLGAETGALDRFLREARAASRLKHPHIINIWESGVTDDAQPYFVMDYLEGVTLADLVSEKGYLHVGRALPIVQQICEALSEAHRQSIVHRDIKPENIVLQANEGDNNFDDFVKVLDFGIADQPAGSEQQQRQKTAAGSPAYMSPEQCQGFHLDGRSDIYSLGIVIFEMLTGSRPFEAVDVMTLFRMHVSQKPPTLGQTRSDVKFPAKLEAFIAKALAKKVAQRHQSIKEFQKDFEEACLDAEPNPKGQSKKRTESVPINIYNVPETERLVTITGNMPVKEPHSINADDDPLAALEAEAAAAAAGLSRSEDRQKKDDEVSAAVSRLLKSAKRTAEAFKTAEPANVSDLAREVLTNPGELNAIRDPRSTVPPGSNALGAGAKASPSSQKPDVSKWANQVLGRPAESGQKAAPAAKSNDAPNMMPKPNAPAGNDANASSNVGTGSSVRISAVGTGSAVNITPVGAASSTNLNAYGSKPPEVKTSSSGSGTMIDAPAVKFTPPSTSPTLKPPSAPAQPATPASAASSSATAAPTVATPPAVTGNAANTAKVPPAQPLGRPPVTKNGPGVGGASPATSGPGGSAGKTPGTLPPAAKLGVRPQGQNGGTPGAGAALPAAGTNAGAASSNNIQSKGAPAAIPAKPFGQSGNAGGPSPSAPPSTNAPTQPSSSPVSSSSKPAGRPLTNIGAGLLASAAAKSEAMIRSEQSQNRVESKGQQPEARKEETRRPEPGRAAAPIPPQSPVSSQNRPAFTTTGENSVNKVPEASSKFAEAFDKALDSVLIKPMSEDKFAPRQAPPAVPVEAPPAASNFTPPQQLAPPQSAPNAVRTDAAPAQQASPQGGLPQGESRNKFTDAVERALDAAILPHAREQAKRSLDKLKAMKSVNLDGSFGSVTSSQQLNRFEQPVNRAPEETKPELPPAARGIDQAIYSSVDIDRFKLELDKVTIENPTGASDPSRFDRPVNEGRGSFTAPPAAMPPMNEPSSREQQSQGILPGAFGGASTQSASKLDPARFDQPINRGALDEENPFSQAVDRILSPTGEAPRSESPLKKIANTGENKTIANRASTGINMSRLEEAARGAAGATNSSVSADAAISRFEKAVKGISGAEAAIARFEGAVSKTTGGSSVQNQEVDNTGVGSSAAVARVEPSGHDAAKAKLEEIRRKLGEETGKLDVAAFRSKMAEEPAFFTGEQGQSARESFAVANSQSQAPAGLPQNPFAAQEPPPPLPSLPPPITTQSTTSAADLNKMDAANRLLSAARRSSEAEPTVGTGSSSGASKVQPEELKRQIEAVKQRMRDAGGLSSSKNSAVSAEPGKQGPTESNMTDAVNRILEAAQKGEITLPPTASPFAQKPANPQVASPFGHLQQQQQQPTAPQYGGSETPTLVQQQRNETPTVASSMSNLKGVNPPVEKPSAPESNTRAADILSALREAKGMEVTQDYYSGFKPEPKAALEKGKANSQRAANRVRSMQSKGGGPNWLILLLLAVLLGVLWYTGLAKQLIDKVMPNSQTQNSDALKQVSAAKDALEKKGKLNREEQEKLDQLRLRAAQLYHQDHKNVEAMAELKKIRFRKHSKSASYKSAQQMISVLEMDKKADSDKKTDSDKKANDKSTDADKSSDADKHQE